MVCTTHGAEDKSGVAFISEWISTCNYGTAWSCASRLQRTAVHNSIQTLCTAEVCSHNSKPFKSYLVPRQKVTIEFCSLYHV